MNNWYVQFLPFFYGPIVWARNTWQIGGGNIKRLQFCQTGNDPVKLSDWLRIRTSFQLCLRDVQMAEMCKIITKQEVTNSRRSLT